MSGRVNIFADALPKRRMSDAEDKEGPAQKGGLTGSTERELRKLAGVRDTGLEKREGLYRPNIRRYRTEKIRTGYRYPNQGRVRGTKGRAHGWGRWVGALDNLGISKERGEGRLRAPTSMAQMASVALVGKRGAIKWAMYPIYARRGAADRKRERLKEPTQMQCEGGGVEGLHIQIDGDGLR